MWDETTVLGAAMKETPVLKNAVGRSVFSRDVECV
jgi:hypothetical protein